MPGSLFSSSRSVVVAAAHASAPPLDRDAGVAKACQIIADASAAGARLVVFSESFIPGFPIWTGIFPPVDGHSLFRRFAENALNPQDKPFRTIMEAAARHRIYVSLGFCEVSSRSPGRLWNSQALISDEGVLLNLHRKLVPTYYEQLVWDRGDSEGLRVMDTPIGRIGGLVCGENNNPLARYVLMGKARKSIALAIQRYGRSVTRSTARSTICATRSVFAPRRTVSKPRSSPSWPRAWLTMR